MANDGTLDVRVAILHSEIDAVLYAPESYPIEVGKLLKKDVNMWRADDGSIWAKGSQYRHLGQELVFPRSLPASTTMRQLKELIKEEFKIPVSIQHGFVSFHNNYYFGNDQLPPKFPDDTTLGQVQENDTSAQETEKVKLIMCTTAFHIANMDPERTLRNLRTSWNAQNYLRSKLKNASNKSDDATVAQWTKQLEEEKSRGDELTNDLLLDLHDWDQTVDYKTNLPRDFCLNLERRYYLWAKTQDEYLQLQLGKNYGDPGPAPLSKCAPLQPKSWHSTDREDQVLEYNFLREEEGADRIVARPIRYSTSGELDPESSSFEIRSGVMLWGQLHSIFDGSRSSNFLGNAENVPEKLKGGTILRWPLQPFRCAARNGEWKVRKVFRSYWTFPKIYSDGVVEPRQKRDRHLGWAVVQEDYDPLEIVERVSRIDDDDGSRSLGNNHVDKDVLFINRYDWFYHRRRKNDHALQDLIRHATGAFINETASQEARQFVDAQYLHHRNRGHLSMIDATEFFPDFVTSYIRDCAVGNETERIFIREPPEGEEGEKRRFGAYVAGYDTEYEFAWLVFSGKKHRYWTEADELIGIVYDATYDLFQGDRVAVEPEPGETVDNPKEAQGLRWNLPYFQAPVPEHRILHGGAQCQNPGIHLVFPENNELEPGDAPSREHL